MTHYFYFLQKYSPFFELKVEPHQNYYDKKQAKAVFFPLDLLYLQNLPYVREKILEFLFRSNINIKIKYNKLKIK